MSTTSTSIVELLIKSRNESQAGFAQLGRDVDRLKAATAEFARTSDALAASQHKIGDEIGRSLEIGKRFDDQLVNAKQKAREYAEALLDTERASRLTTAQQKEATAAIEKGVEAYRRSGETIPASISLARGELDKLSVSQGKASTSTAGLTQMIGALGPVAAAVGITSLGAMALGAINTGGALDVLNRGTQISITGLGRLGYAAELNESSVDQLASAAVQLSKRLSEGRDSTVGAVEKLGLSFQELRALSPELQIEAVSEALSATNDQGLRAETAIRLFGTAGADLLPTLTTNLRETGDEAERLGLVLSEDDVRALDELGDAFTTWRRRAEVEIGQVVARLVEFSRTGRNAANSWAAAWEAAGQFFGLPQDAVNFPGSKMPAFRSHLFETPQLPLAPGQSGYRSQAEAEAADRRWRDATRPGLPGQAAGLGFPEVDTDRIARALDEDRRRREDETRQRATVTRAIEEQEAAERKLIDTQRKGYEQLDRAALTIFPKHLAFLAAEREELSRGTDELVGRIQAENVRLGLLPDDRDAVLATLGPNAKGKSAGPGIRSVDSWRDDVATVSNALGDLAQAFAHISQLSGDLDGFVSSAARWLAHTNASMKAGQQIRAGLDAENPWEGALQVGIGGVAGAAALWQATGGESRRGNVLGGLSQGAALGTAVMPGIGTAIGAGVGALIGAVRNPEAKAYDRRDDFFAQFGGSGTGEDSGFHRVAARLTEATGQEGGGDLFAQLIEAGTVAEVEAAIRLVVKAFEDADVAAAELKKTTEELAKLTEGEFDRMWKAADKYGIRLESLGKEFQTQLIRDEADDIVKTFNEIVANGGDAGGTLMDLADEVSGLVGEAKRLGVSIPESMRPLIDELFRAGLLVDGTGTKLENLNGINFSQAVDALHGLADAARAASDAVEGVSGAEPNTPEFRGPAVEGEAAKGLYANRPGLVVFGEGGEAEVGGPRSFFRDVFRSLGIGQSASGGGPTVNGAAGGGSGSVVIQAIDAESFLSYMRRVGGRAFVQWIRESGIARNELNRALEAST